MSQGRLSGWWLERNAEEWGEIPGKALEPGPGCSVRVDRREFKSLLTFTSSVTLGRPHPLPEFSFLFCDLGTIDAHLAGVLGG